jgi:hypothetical protein
MAIWFDESQNVLYVFRKTTENTFIQRDVSV